MKPHSECPWVESDLTAYLTGDLPAARAAAIRVHLAGCESCRASAQELAITLDLLRGALAASPTGPECLDPAHRAAVLAVHPSRATILLDTWLVPLARAAIFILVPALILAALMLPAMNAGRTLVGKRSQVPAGSNERNGMAYDSPTDSAYAVGRAEDRLSKASAPASADASVSRARGDGSGTGRGNAFHYDDAQGVRAEVKKQKAAAADLSLVSAEPTPPGDSPSSGRGLDGHATAPAVPPPAPLRRGTFAAAPPAPPAPDVPAVAAPAGEAGDLDLNRKTGELRVKAPKPMFVGTPVPAKVPNLEPPGTPQPRMRLAEAEEKKERAVAAAPAGAKSDANERMASKSYGGQPSPEETVTEESERAGVGVGGFSMMGAGSSEVRPDRSAIALRIETARPAGRESGLARGSSAAGAAIASEGRRALGEDLMFEDAEDKSRGPGGAPAKDQGAKKDASSGSALEELGKGNSAPLDPKKLEEQDGAVAVRAPAPAVFNPVVETAENAVSTFSIDVDTASYSMARRAILDGKRPAPESVRTEEFVNAFDYDYAPPEKGAFAIHVDGAPSPFRKSMDVLRIGIKGRRIGRDRHVPSNLTLVIDTSGSMQTDDRIGLIRRSLRMLIDRLDPEDRVAVVQFGSQAALRLEPTPAAQKAEILKVIDSIETVGSTQLEGGLKLGYEVAAKAFRGGASNRVILMSDGVANLGATEAAGILATVEAHRKQGVRLTVLGFGAGAYDDAMLETLADKGDGAYAFIDSEDEAKRVLVDNLAATLHTIASDVKIQVEFNPRSVRSWRQLGYENRALTREQFRDDAVDAGEVGSGQSVTALYDVKIDGQASEWIAAVRVRYRDLETGRIEEIERRIAPRDFTRDFAASSPRFRLAAGVAEFAELLRLSPHTFSKGRDLADALGVLRPVALELSLDPQIQELARLAQAAQRLPY